MRWFWSPVMLSMPLVLAACGARQSDDASVGSLDPAPPVRAIDEAAPDVVASIAARITPGLRPVKGVYPRAIARLELPEHRADTSVTLATWRSRSGKLCLATETKNPEWGGGAYAPFGPCEPDVPPCGDLCLQRSAYGVGAELTYVLTGTVGSGADELQVDYLDGEAARFPLVGPVVPGFPQSRVFMLDLGRRLFRKLELRSRGKMTASGANSRAELEWERCLMDSVPEGQGRKSAKEDVLATCADRAEAQGPFGN